MPQFKPIQPKTRDTWLSTKKTLVSDKRPLLLGVGIYIYIKTKTNDVLLASVSNQAMTKMPDSSS